MFGHFYICYCVFFFFSSRRRHTRWTGDWSSDVCSSDLVAGDAAEHVAVKAAAAAARRDEQRVARPDDERTTATARAAVAVRTHTTSEHRQHGAGDDGERAARPR